MKKTLKNTGILLAILFIQCTLKAQQLTLSETLAKVEAQYKSAKFYDLDISFTMFKGYTGDHITETYNGNILKNEDVNCIKILGSEILQFPNVQLTINDKKKTVVYTKISNDFKQNSPLEISKFLTYYKEVSRITNGNVTVFELGLINSKLSVPYSKIVLYINTLYNTIEKQELYLSTKVPFIDKDGKQTEDAARLLIELHANTESPRTIPKLQHYIQLEPRLALAQDYATYTLIDQTKK